MIKAIRDPSGVGPLRFCDYDFYSVMISKSFQTSTEILRKNHFIIMIITFFNITIIKVLIYYNKLILKLLFGFVIK